MALSKPKWLYDEHTFNHTTVPTKKIVVHTITLGDVEDPEVYIGEHIWEWQQTESGKFVMQNSLAEPSFHKIYDYTFHGHTYHIVAYFDAKTVTYWNLKYA